MLGAAAVCIALCAYEFSSFAVPGARMTAFSLPLYCVLPGLLAVYYGWNTFIFFFIAGAVLAIAQSLAFFERQSAELPRYANGLAILLGYFYFALFGGILIYIAGQKSAVNMLLWLMAGVIACDTGAYFGGKLWGKKKLVPLISPNKTVVGSISGLICCLLAGIVVLNLTGVCGSAGANCIVGQGALCLAVGLLAQMGDLLESLWKRAFNVKNSSDLLPGHGGLFDRFDAILLAAPMCFFVQKYFER